MAKKISDDDLVEISGGTGDPASELQERADRYNQPGGGVSGPGSGGGTGNTGMGSTGGSTGGAQEWSD